MTVVISKKLPKIDVDVLLEKVKRKPKMFDAKQYFGKALIAGDPLKVQLEMRNE